MHANKKLPDNISPLGHIHPPITVRLEHNFRKYKNKKGKIIETHRGIDLQTLRVCANYQERMKKKGKGYYSKPNILKKRRKV